LRYEFVVIGGGVVGSATAWGLAGRGARVLVLERGTVACGASGGPGKRGVRANGRDIRELPLARQAYDIWPSLEETLKGDTGYERLGGLEVIAGDERAVGRLEARRRAQAAAGVPTRLVGADELAELEPGIAAGSEARYAWYCPLDGIGDHTATTRAFADAAVRAGAELREGTEARRVRSGTGGTVVETDADEVTASRAVLVLNNSYAADLLDRSYGIGLPLWRMAPQMNFVRTAHGPRRLLGHDTRALAVKPLPDGTVMISGGRLGRWDTAADRGEVVDDSFAGNLADATAVLPGLADAEFVDSDASRPESVSVDGVPVIDRLPVDGTVYVGAGWSGHGFAISPAVAANLVTWALSGVRPDVLAPFGLDRMP
jgi:sarcosine oxidase subunit beta